MDPLLLKFESFVASKSGPVKNRFSRPSKMLGKTATSAVERVRANADYGKISQKRGGLKPVPGEKMQAFPTGAEPRNSAR